MSERFANREVCDLILYDYTTKKPALTIDYANVSSTEVTGEAVYAYGGKGHPKRVPFYGEKGGTLTIETQIQTMKLYSMLSGADIETTATFVKRVKVTSDENKKINVPSNPKAGTIFIYPATDDAGTELTGTFTAATGTTGYDITDTGETDAIAASTDYIVYYMEEITSGVQKLNIKSSTVPKAFTVYGDTFMKSEDEEILPYKFIAYKCAPQQTFSLSFSNTGDPGSITITCDLLVDEDNNLMDMILQEEEDA